MRQTGATRTDLLVGLILILPLTMFAIAAVEVTDETEARVACSFHLRMLGQALLLYSNDNRGQYPRTIADVQKNQPVWGTPYEGNEKLIADDARAQRMSNPFDAKDAAVPAANDVTAALYLLVRTQDITSEVYVCPSSGQEKWDYGGGTNTPLNWTNWPGIKPLSQHLSYSMQNPYVPPKAIGEGWKWNNTLSPEYAVAGDMNPGVDVLTKLTRQSPRDELRKGNSINHGGEGQNVLFGDGHCEWVEHPFAGVQFDNIYTFGDSGDRAKDKGGDGIVGASVGPFDSILLPTSKDLGNVDAAGTLREPARQRRENAIAAMKPATPQELDAIRAKIPGTYFTQKGNYKIKMEITDNRISATSGPMTIAFGYTIAGAAKDSVKLSLTAPDTKATAVIKFIDDGIEIRGNDFLAGEWRRQ